MAGILSTIGEHTVAEPTNGSTHHVQLVFNLRVLAQPLVLQDHRNIILPPGFRQRQLTAFVIFEQHQPGQALHHLLTGLAVGVRMEPAGSCRLLDSELHPARCAWLNQRLRSTVYVTGDFQTVPVNGTGFRQRIADIHRDRFATL